MTYGDFSEAYTKLTVADPAKVGELWLELGDLFIERSNTPDLVGTARLYKGPRHFAIFPDLLIRVRFGPEVLPEFAELQLRSARARGYFTNNAQGTAGSMPKIDQGLVARLPFMLPPLSEQQRIVDAVSTLHTHLSAARDRLARVREALKHFRQSVLVAACSGRLTEAWRERHALHPLTLDALIAARRRAWIRAETARRRREDRPIRDADLFNRYVAPHDPAPRGDAPDSWLWTTLDQITLLSGGLTKGQQRRPNAKLRRVPYLRVANVQRGHIDLSVIKDIEATDNEIADLRLQTGDILLNEGGDVDKLGRGWVWEGQIDTCVHQTMSSERGR